MLNYGTTIDTTFQCLICDGFALDTKSAAW
jgi:hypothetical protein